MNRTTTLRWMLARALGGAWYVIDRRRTRNGRSRPILGPYLTRAGARIDAGPGARIEWRAW